MCRRERKVGCCTRKWPVKMAAAGTNTVSQGPLCSPGGVLAPASGEVDALDATGAAETTGAFGRVEAAAS